jgi:uncharacterized damage-inducible protein DinB
MTIAATLMQELEMEAATTRRVLERVPEAQLNWKPAEKSRTLGQLAWHIAVNPGSVASLASTTPAQMPRFDVEASPTSTSELLSTLDNSVAQAKALVGGMDDSAMTATWTLMAGDKTLMAMPRVALIRSIMLNHWYHHRGQLSVYLRQLGVPLPSIYGPSADESPFM